MGRVKLNPAATDRSSPAKIGEQQPQGGNNGLPQHHCLDRDRGRGRLAGRVLVKGGGFGLLGDIVVGIIGAFIGGWLAGVLHIHVGGGWISTIITAAVGASILLLILRLVRRG